MSALSRAQNQGISFPLGLLRRRRLLVAAVVLAALLLLGIKGWRLYERAQVLRGDVQSLEALSRARPDRTTLAGLGPLLAGPLGQKLVVLAPEEVPPAIFQRELGLLADVALEEHPVVGVQVQDVALVGPGFHAVRGPQA